VVGRFGRIARNLSVHRQLAVAPIQACGVGVNLATGEVLHRTRRPHTGADVLSFFKRIDAHVEGGLNVHVVLDNLSAHKCEPVQKWLAHPKQKRWHLHFTPTSSWPDLIETWFSILTRKALTNTSINSVKALGDAIDEWASNWNDDL
jgi:transposase